VEEGASPTPVEATRLEPNGGVSDTIHRIGEENMKDHKKGKAIKHKTVYPPL
jgi:hypothetical protein